MNPNAIVRQFIDRRAYIDGIPAKPIQLRDDQNIVSFEPIYQPSEALTLHSRDRAGYRLNHDALGIHLEARCLNLANLIVCRLLGGADAAISEGTSHNGNPCIDSL
jgi:hypothetical protein